MTLQLLSQMQDTELQSKTYHHRVGTTVSGKASQAKECDELASNVTVYNVTMNACEKEDLWSIELKMLAIVEKQLSEELAVFRSMGAKCLEKTHRSNSVLMNTLRVRLVAASALHHPVTSRADEENRPDEQHVKMEQNSFQSKHVSGLQGNAA